MTALDLASLLASRICHDLVGPVGAIANGLEVLEEDDGEMREPAIELLNHSVAEALARLKFYRIAFGASGGQAQVALAEYRDVATDYFASGRVELAWQGQTGAGAGRLAKPTLRALLNALIVSADSLPRGGTLAIAIAGDASGFTLTASSQRAHFAEPVTRVLDGRADVGTLEPRFMPAQLLVELVAAAGGSLERTEEEGRTVIVAAL